jgi:hypothetical protein
MSVFEQVELKGKYDGTNYKTANVTSGNALFVTNQEYLHSILEGAISGHHLFRKTGYSNVIGNTLVDLTNAATAAAYVFPAAGGVQMQIKSGGNAADAGSVGFSGTGEAGGSLTTLVDTSKNFAAGTPVAAGDKIILTNGNKKELGVVTGVAATVLTCANGFSGGATGASKAYQVIDISAGGTGAQACLLSYLDANYAEKQTIIVPNGASAVDSVPTDILRVQDFEVIAVGSSGAAVGAIILTDKATATAVYATIGATQITATSAIWTCPNTTYDGTTITFGAIVGWQVSGAKATGAPVTTFRLRATRFGLDFYNPNVFKLVDISTMVQGTGVFPLQVPIKLPPRADVKISCQSDTTGVTCSGRFNGWYE